MHWNQLKENYNNLGDDSIILFLITIDHKMYLFVPDLVSYYKKCTYIFEFDNKYNWDSVILYQNNHFKVIPMTFTSNKLLHNLFIQNNFGKSW